MTTVKKIGPCGGAGGTPREMNVDGISRILKITLIHNVNVVAITVKYLRNGKEESTEKWGGTYGTVKELEFQPNEYITAVKGYFGHNSGVFVVRSVKFETNLKTWGPYGTEDGIPFELPAINGQIIGFHGRFGGLVDALGVIVKVNDKADGATASTNTDGVGKWTESKEDFWDRPVTKA